VGAIVAATATCVERADFGLFLRPGRRMGSREPAKVGTTFAERVPGRDVSQLYEEQAFTKRTESSNGALGCGTVE
jgi:hypothetical protein